MLSDNLEKMKACADMILSDAIEDMAEEEQISFIQARNKIISCGAYDCLYDFKSELWMEGPDYFRCFVKEMDNKKKTAS